MSISPVASDRVLPWQMTHNGHHWYDMPGAAEDEKKMNFFLYRRGLLEVEEIDHEREDEREAAQFIERGGDTVPMPMTRRLRVKMPKLWGGGKHGPHRAVRGGQVHPSQGCGEWKCPRSSREAAAVRPNVEVPRARLKARLMTLKAHYGAIRQVTNRAGLRTATLFNLINCDMGMREMEVIQKTTAVLDALDRGEWELRVMPRGRVAGTERGGVPEGYVALKRWLVVESSRLGCDPHALRMRLFRGEVTLPPGTVRKNKRCIFVPVSAIDGRAES